MKALTDSGLLDLWESGVRRHPLDRAVLILGAAHPDAGYDTLADWPLGRRNRSIAQLRRACFGGGIHGWMACPRCGDKLEFELDARALAADDAGDRDRQPTQDRSSSANAHSGFRPAATSRASPPKPIPIAPRSASSRIA